LYEIMQNEGPQKSLIWLTSILQKEKSTLSVIPTLILCELLLVEKDDKILIKQIVQRLTKSLIHSTKEESFQIFSFFLEKLIDKKNEIRKLSQNALKRLLEES